MNHLLLTRGGERSGFDSHTTTCSLLHFTAAETKGEKKRLKSISLCERVVSCPRMSTDNYREAEEGEEDEEGWVRKSKTWRRRG